MRIPDRIISDITEKLDMADVVSEYVHLQKKGNRYWGLCPFHTEKTASFCVTPEKSVFYCFGCQKGGSLYNFIMDVEKLSFFEAAKFLAEKAGIDLAYEEKDSGQREAYIELYRRVAGTFHYFLTAHTAAGRARNYLMQRGITQDTIEAFNIGYAPVDGNWLFNFLQDKNYSKDFLEKSGLFTGREKLRAFFRDRIVFPIRNSRDEVIAFGGRSLSDTGPKYLNTPDTLIFRKGENLFGQPGILKKIRQEGEFILVEGYMDVIALYQNDIGVSVAPLGTAVTSGQVRLLKRYAENGILLFDGDEAGVRATEKAIKLFEQQNFLINIMELDSDRDPADIIEKDGPETLKNSLKYPITSFQFLLKKAFLKYDYHTPNGKQGVFEFLNSYLSIVESHVKRDGYLRVLAETLEVDFESVRNDFLMRYRKDRGANKQEAALAAQIDFSSDLFLLLAVTVSRVHFARLRAILSVDDLEDSRARELFIALEECFRNEEESLETLLDRIEDTDLKRMLLEKISSEEFSINQDRLIRDGMNRIRQRNLEKKRNRLTSELSRPGWNTSELKELLSEKMHLDEELINLKVIHNERTAE